MSHKTGAGAALNPDNRIVAGAVAVLTMVVFLAAALMSFQGLYAVGLEQGLKGGQAAATPIMIDASILVFTGVSLIQRRRGNRWARGLAIASVGVATLMSSTLNLLHSLSEVGFSTFMEGCATVASTSAPVFIWVTTEHLAGLVLKQPPAPRAPSAKAVTAKKRTTPARKPAPVVRHASPVPTVGFTPEPELFRPPTVSPPRPAVPVG